MRSFGESYIARGSETAHHTRLSLRSGSDEKKKDNTASGCFPEDPSSSFFSSFFSNDKYSRGVIFIRPACPQQLQNERLCVCVCVMWCDRYEDEKLPGAWVFFFCRYDEQTVKVKECSCMLQLRIMGVWMIRCSICALHDIGGLSEAAVLFSYYIFEQMRFILLGWMGLWKFYDTKITNFSPRMCILEYGSI